MDIEKIISEITKEMKEKDDPLEGLRAGIRNCIENNILKDYLIDRKQEVLNQMADFWDEKSAREIHEFNLSKKAENKGFIKGKKEGKAKERSNSICRLINTLKRLQISTAMNEKSRGKIVNSVWLSLIIYEGIVLRTSPSLMTLPSSSGRKNDFTFKGMCLFCKGLSVLG